MSSLARPYRVNTDREGFKGVRQGDRYPAESSNFGIGATMTSVPEKYVYSQVIYLGRF
jgi:hypothetical protein